MSCAYNPSTFGRLRWEDSLRSGVQDQPKKHSKTPFLQFFFRLAGQQWRAAVIPATQEAEAGESLEPRRGISYLLHEITKKLNKSKEATVLKSIGIR